MDDLQQILEHIDQGRTRGVETSHPQYLYWLRIAVESYLENHSRADLVEAWPTLRDETLRDHGYLDNED